MPADDGHEIGISSRGECRECLSGDKQEHSGDPLLEAKTNGCGQRSVEDGHSARRAAQQDGLGQGTMNGDFKTLKIRSSRHLEKRPAAEGKEGKEE